jgi:hypothetical protein
MVCPSEVIVPSNLSHALRVTCVAAVAGVLVLPSLAVADDEHRSPRGTQHHNAAPGSQGATHRATPAPKSARPTPKRGATHSSTKGTSADPAGNNGTIKIDYPAPADSGHANRPHPGCGFQLRMFNFDNDQYGELVVRGQAPTAVGTLLTRRILLSDDAAGGGQDVDEVYSFTAADLGLTGAAPNKNGWHLKVAVDAENAPGGAKQKVFWLDCPAPAVAAPAAQSLNRGSALVAAKGLALEQPTVTSELTYEANSAVKPTRVAFTGGGGIFRGAALPFTGMELMLLLTAGAGLLVAGGMAVAAARRRTGCLRAAQLGGRRTTRLVTAAETSGASERAVAHLGQRVHPPLRGLSGSWGGPAAGGEGCGQLEAIDVGHQAHRVAVAHPHVLVVPRALHQLPHDDLAGGRAGQVC